MSRGTFYDGTPTQAGLEQESTTLTGTHAHFNLIGLREMAVVERKFVDTPGNRAGAYVEYTCRDMYTGELLFGCRRVHMAAGLENGDDFVLHPATKLRDKTTGKELTRQTPAQNTDGDRVLVGFIEGSRARPIILGVLTHSNATYSSKIADGERRLTLHGGTAVLLKENGEYSVTHKTGALVTILDSGDIQVTPAPGKDVFLGDAGATENLVLGQQFKAFAESLIDALSSATYPTGLGPSGTMLPPSVTTLSQLKAALDDLLSDMAFTQKEVL